jgi:hypothetical protein
MGTIIFCARSRNISAGKTIHFRSGFYSNSACAAASKSLFAIYNGINSVTSLILNDGPDRRTVLESPGVKRFLSPILQLLAQRCKIREE